MDNYIQIEMGGKPRGLKFNQGALIIFQSKIDKLNAVATTAYALVWAGLKANAFVKEEEFTETFEQVCEWVDEMNEETISKIIACFNKTQEFQKAVIPDSKKKIETLPEVNTDSNVIVSPGD